MIAPDSIEIVGRLTLGDLSTVASTYELRRMTGPTASTAHSVARFDIPELLVRASPALLRLRTGATIRQADLSRVRVELPASLQLRAANDQPASGYERDTRETRCTHPLAPLGRSIETGSASFRGVSAASAYTFQFGAATGFIDPVAGTVRLELNGVVSTVATTAAFARADLTLSTTSSVRTQLMVGTSTGASLEVTVEGQPNPFDPLVSVGGLSSASGDVIAIAGVVRVQGYARETVFVYEGDLAGADMKHTVELPEGFALRETAHIATLEIVSGAGVVTAANGGVGTVAASAGAPVEWVVAERTVTLRSTSAVTVRLRVDAYERVHGIPDPRDIFGVRTAMRGSRRILDRLRHERPMARPNGRARRARAGAGARRPSGARSLLDG